MWCQGGLSPASRGDLGEIRLYLRYLGVSLRAQLQYRVSFFMQLAGTGLVSVTEFFGIWALFARFERLGPWTLPEVSVFYGVVNMAWGVTESLGRGFDDFGALVKSGDFDRCLLRPRSLVFQVLGREFTLRRIGRIGQGVTVITRGWTALGLGASPEKLALLVAAVAGGVAVFLGLLIVQATLAFWTVESLEIMNVMTYGGVTTSQYPLSIYPGWLRRFFTFFVPLGSVVYFPVVRVLGKADPLGSPHWLGWVGPLTGFLFFAAALQLWLLGVRRYTSTGS